MSTMKIKKGDTVKVIAGKDKDKEGKVLSVDKKNGRVVVEGVNMVTKHVKPSAANQDGGIVLRSIFLLVGVVLFSVMIYVFPLTARYENTIRATFRNAVILTVGKLPYTILMIAVTVGAVIVSLWNTATLMFALPLWFLIGGSLIAWINSYILRRVFLVFEDNENGTDNDNMEKKE